MGYKIIIAALLLICLPFNESFAQDDKTVTLVVSGQGKTKEEATQSALLSAIEQAFGAFISSKTEILNEKLVKDEIVSISNGNIQKYDVVSEVEIPAGGFAMTLKTVVSVTKFTSFCESKGVNAEFKGSLFVFNIAQQKLNEESESKAISAMCSALKNMSDQSFDFDISPSDPKANNDNSNIWTIPLRVNVKLNKNFENYKSYFQKTLGAISMTEVEASDYIKLKKPIYTVVLINENKIYGKYYLRNYNSSIAMQELLLYFVHSLQYFTIDDGVTKRTYVDIVPAETDYTNERNYVISESCDDYFRPVILQSVNDEMEYHFSPLNGAGVGKFCSRPYFYRNPRPFNVEYYKELPLRRCGQTNIFVANVSLNVKQGGYNYGDFRNDQAIKLISKTDYPNLETELIGYIILNSSFNIVLNFNNLTDPSGISATYLINDSKTLDEIKRIKEYKIYTKK